MAIPVEDRSNFASQFLNECEVDIEDFRTKLGDFLRPATKSHLSRLLDCSGEEAEGFIEEWERKE